MMSIGPNPSGVERIDVDRAFELYRDRQAVFVDVRDRSEFERERIPGSLSVPLHELSRRMDEIPLDRPVITYCA
jgi:hydroxyacylglutathione hydrolase